MREALGKEFGTKRAKKAIASMTENAITRKTIDGVAPGDSLTTAVLSNLATNTASIPSREEKQAVIDESKPRPKPNLAATTPADVYPLDVVISEETMRDIPIKEWREAHTKGEDVEVKSLFVANRMYNLATRDEEISNLKALRYLYMLVQFYLALKPGREGHKKLPTKAELSAKVEASSSLLDGIKRTFAEGG
jgi:DNA-directed RNA polymerase I subunit RPA49